MHEHAVPVWVAVPLVNRFSICLRVSPGQRDSPVRSLHINKQPEVGPLATLQLEEVRQATARYLDVDAAVADGYVDIGAFVPVHRG
jgi:hypothetical protein